METSQNSILNSIENIHKTSKGTKLQLENYEKVETEINTLSEYFNITHIQSIILSSIIGLSGIDEIELIEVINYFDLDKIEFLKYAQHLLVLQNKNILGKRSSRNFSREDYYIKEHLLHFIISNKPIPKELIELKIKEESFNEFLADMDKLSNQKDNSEIDYRFFKYKFQKLLNDNKKYKLVEYAIQNLELLDSFVFFDVILDALTTGDNDFNSGLQSTVNDFTENNRATIDYVTKFIEGKTKLNVLDLVEKDKAQFANKYKLQLTQKAVKMLYELEGIKIGYSIKKNERLIYPEDIKKMELYYNTLEMELLEPMDKSLSKKSFVKLQNRLIQNNMPSGITTLLYGAPGTGKTETVYQLAKKHKRPVFKVEISETKSMWFGESQKLIKKIFTDYYEFKRNEKICPILLFNEADAIIGKRKKSEVSSVADTENAIQNILLEELENFDGIFMATTNLVDNIDPAFERRFLFKIKFEKPNVKTATNIWKSKLKIVSDSEAEILASRYHYSGGEMQNIARKCILEEIVLGSKLTFEKIISFCENEKWNNNKTITKIGF